MWIMNWAGIRAQNSVFKGRNFNQCLNGTIQLFHQYSGSKSKIADTTCNTRNIEGWVNTQNLESFLKAWGHLHTKNKNSIRNQKGDFTSAQTGKTDTP